MSTKVRLLVCDDSREIRSLLRELLSESGEIEVVAEAADGREAVRLAETLRPDAVLMDVAMPILDGFAATRLLRERCPEARVVAYTAADSPETVTGMFEAGASDYCTKSAPMWELERAILGTQRPLVHLAATLARAGGGANVAELVVRELATLLPRAEIALYLADADGDLVPVAGACGDGDSPAAQTLIQSAYSRLLLVQAPADPVGGRPALVAVPVVADGVPLGVLLCASPGRRARKRELQVLAEAVDLAAGALLNERRLAHSYLEARSDPLTQLPNRRAFDEHLEHRLGEAAEAETSVGLAVLDLDGFKQINDREGHLAGDRVLRVVARVLQRTLRVDEEVFRIGGDEFAIVIGSGDVVRVAERVREAVGRQKRGRPLPTLSAGTAVYPRDAADARELYRQADAALNASKRAGKNKVTRRIRARDEPPPPPPDAEAETAPAWQRLRVLLVDDDPALRLLLRTTVEAADVEVDEAASAAEADRKIGLNRPDVVLLDVDMPGLDGVSFCRVLRERPETQDLGIVILSGAEFGHAETAIAAGANAYVRKPFSPLDLLAVLDRVAAEKDAALTQILRAPQEQLLLYANDIRRLLWRERRQRELLQAAYQETVGALVSALDLKETGADDHSRRVQQYAVELTRTIEPGLLDEPSLEYGFLLHDIGKIQISDKILQKRTRLTASERRLVETHSELGAQMLAGVPLVQGDGIAVVRHHHERWDGHGYPEGLMHADIPLSARIFAVADALDAITSDRPYRPAASWTVATAELARSAGTHFDPDVVGALRDAEPQLRRVYAQHAARKAARRRHGRRAAGAGPARRQRR